MLILAGVSINAIVGENGVLSRAQYTSFMSEMAAVEEAVQLWKAGELIESNGQSNTAIPANGLCKVNVLENAERLSSEIGYYRLWSSRKAMPTEADVLSSLEIFNDKYGNELVPYPAGVQDLYYLNNEALNLDKNKVYLIDAATSMVYSTTGITLNGVRCYSTHMAKAVMGNNVAPIFSEAEISGGGDNIIYAGETYLKDKNGNYIDEDGNIVSEENKVLNPNGFQIIANLYSKNIYKLYNNGDLYGKGVKGVALNTSLKEMAEINAYTWNTFTIPDVIPGAKSNDVTIIPGYNTIYVIDSEKYLWAWGANGNNKLGLTQDEQVEYTGRTPIKLNIDGKTVKNVYPGKTNATFVVTEDNQIYAAGYNAEANLGVGYKSNELDKFTNISVEKTGNIKKIISSAWNSLIWYEDNTFYFAGKNQDGILGKGTRSEYYNTFTQIWNEEFGLDIDSEIQDVLLGSSCMILFKDGTIKQSGYTSNDGHGSGAGSLVAGDSRTFREFSGDFDTNVTNIYGGVSWRVIRRVTDTGEIEFWGSPGRDNQLGLPKDTYGSSEFFKIPLPDELEDEGVKEVYTINSAVYYLSNTGKVYSSGAAVYSGLNRKSGTLTEVTYTGLNNIDTLYHTDVVKITTSSDAASGPVCFTGKDGKIYTTGQSTIVFGDNILQKSWAKIAEDVKYVDANDSLLLYVNNNNELFMSGANKEIMGLGENNIENINQLFKHPDTNIQGKVDRVYVSEGVTYVLTTDGILYGTGYYTDNGASYYPGWSSTENQKSFVEILNNVKVFATDQSNDSRIAFLSDGTAYGWGRNAGGMNGYSYASTNVPTKYELPSDMGGVDNVLKMKTYDSYRSCLVTKDGKFFMSGYNTVNNAYDGGQAAKNYWYRYTHNLTLNDGEKIIQAAPLNQSNMLLLTDKGRVFGWGANCYLGLNNTSTSFVETQLLSGIDNVSQVIAGPNWYIAIKNDGTVWGTGQNTYGILGRWIGVDRSTPNSRYKTAFEWVECPELEI